MKKNTMAAVLAVISLGAFIGAVALLWFRDVPTANKDFINFSLGALQAFAAAGIYYYLGSSKSSSDKTDLLASKGTGGEPPAPPAG